MAHADGRQTTVPVHKGRDVGPGLLRKILRDVKMTTHELKDLL
jgi:predicted RNA binding protein YcfA (HicA-like mRNA interferase family)